MNKLLIITCLVILATPLAVSQTVAYEVDTQSRVVAFADVHGAFEDWTAMLKELGLINEQLDWSGGDTHMVSLGDLVDRGPHSRKVVELMMKLDAQAEKAGGAVHLTLGNHEVMLMTGDLRYVSSEEFAAFAEDESETEREQLFADYLRFNPDREQAALRAEFEERYPRGFIALRKAFSQGGEIGDWLLQQPFVIRINDRVYMHGGIDKDGAQENIDDLNRRLKGELKTFLDNMDNLRAAGVMPWYVSYHDRLGFLNARAEEHLAANPRQAAPWFTPMKEVFEAQQAFVFSDDSPNWYRGTALCHPYSESFNTERFLKRVGAKQLVMGHTPTRGEVQARMDGLAIRLDTGMLKSVYKGRASALVIEGKDSHVHYLGESTPYQPEPERRSLSMELSQMDDETLEDFMLNAEVVSVEEIGTGVTNPWRVEQKQGDRYNLAAFKYEDTHIDLQFKKKYIMSRYNDSDRYIYDVAAYKLDRMLDLQLVPVAIEREINDTRGALSDWIENSINERDREEQGVPFTSYCDKWEQYRVRFMFDILIFNEDRNLTNILWTKDDFMMKFIDHTRAFRSTTKRPYQYRKVKVELSDLARERLKALNMDNLSLELSPYLHERQIEGMLARRDLLLREGISSSP